MINLVRVYGLDESVAASKYPKSIDVSKCTPEITETVEGLAGAPKGTGHDNFLKGIIVQFDLTYTMKTWVQAERYHWFDIVSSQSIMHCIPRFNIRKQCCKYVTEASIKEVERLQKAYLEDKTTENFLRLAYNIPSGFRLTARMTTNYQQLKTIYHQRKYHKLPEWQELCRWIETLPHSEFITGAR